MPILQISPNENVSSLLHSMLKANPADIEWPNYVQARDQVDEQQENLGERILNKKRAMAHKFLRVKNGGKSYCKEESCVFTPQFVRELGNSNAARRSRRNPWLQAMPSDSPENGIATSAPAHENVLPFGPQIVVQNKTADFPG